MPSMGRKRNEWDEDEAQAVADQANYLSHGGHAVPKHHARDLLQSLSSNDDKPLSKMSYMRNDYDDFAEKYLQWTRKRIWKTIIRSFNDPTAFILTLKWVKI